MSDHPFDQQLQALVRHLQIRTLPPFEAEVLGQAGDKLELRLVLDEKLRALWELDRGLQGVPLALQGCWAVQLQPGARVVLEFLDGDRKKPVVRSVIRGTFTEVSIDATSVKVGPTAADVLLGPGLPAIGYRPIVAKNDTSANVAIGSPAALTGVAPSVIANTVVKV